MPDPGHDVSRRRKPRLIAWLIAGLLVLTGWAIASMLVAEEREKAQQAAVMLTRSISGILSDNVHRITGVVDRALLALRDDLKPSPNGGRGNHPRLTLWRTELDPVADMAWHVSMVDRDGEILASTSFMRVGFNIADRAYFIAARQDAPDSLIVSEPFRSQITGEMTVAFARRIRSSDGSFDGIVQAVVRSEVFSSVYQSAALGTAASIAILRADGMKIAEAPASTEGQRNSRASAAVAGVPYGEAAVLRDVDEEGRQRTTAYRAVPGRPLIVRVSMIDSEYLTANPARLATPRIAATALTVIVLVGLVIVLAYQRRIALADARDAHRLRELSERQMILDAALDNMDQGLLMVDAAGTVVVINQKAVELLDLPPQLAKPPFAHRDIFDWQISHSEFSDGKAKIDSDILQQLCEQSRAISVVSSMPEYQRTRPNGTVLSVHTTPLKGGGLVRTFTDVTELYRYSQDLERFAHVASHDLQEPLRKIATHARLLGSAIAEGDGPEVERCRAVLEASARRGRTIVSDLLHYAKLKDEPVQRAEVRLVDLLSPIVSRVRESAPDARISMALAPFAVRCDAGLISQVLENLIGNALKYCKPGQPADLRIEAAYDPIRGDVQIVVRDRGIGFDMAHASEIFQPFKRLVHRNEYAGTGIGLSIVRSIVAKHGWSVAADSVLGEGSAFTVTVPASDVAPVLAAAA